ATGVGVGEGLGDWLVDAVLFSPPWQPATKNTAMARTSKSRMLDVTRYSLCMFPPGQPWRLGKHVLCLHPAQAEFRPTKCVIQRRPAVGQNAYEDSKEGRDSVAPLSEKWSAMGGAGLQACGILHSRKRPVFILQ